MVLRCRGRNYLITERPYQGDGGAKLYVGTGGPENIRYRSARAFNAAKPPLVIDTSRDVSVATVTNPDNEFLYTLPDAYLEPGVRDNIWFNVRTFAHDVENEAISGARKLVVDDVGDEEETVLGTIIYLRSEKRDGGVVRMVFEFRPSPDGVQPTSFRLEQTGGTGTVDDVIVTAGGLGVYHGDVEGLDDGETAVMRISGEVEAVSTVLLSGIDLLADAEGPPEVDDFDATEL